MPSNLQVVNVDRFVAHLAATESMVLYGYAGTIPFNATDPLDSSHHVLAKRNAPVMYDFKTTEIRFRLDAVDNGNIMFMRAFDAEGVLLAQMFPADYTAIPAVIGRIVRLHIPNVHFTMKDEVS